MKLFPEGPQRSLSVELLREIFVGGELHGHKSAANVQRSTPNVQRRIQKDGSAAPRAMLIHSASPTLFSNAQGTARSTLSRRLHELDRRAVGIAHVDDALSLVRTSLKRLRLAGGFPTGRGDFFQHCVEI